MGDTAAKHVRAFDGLRGVAIILVLLRHVGEDSTAKGAGGVLDAVLQSGWLGVDVFFVLSGFLITGILLDARGEADRPADGYYRRFYARRALRIFPAYYAFLVLTMLVGRPPMPHGQWWYWSYMSNVMIARFGWPSGTWDTGHLWSLAVEEQFYLIWPAIIAWTPRRRLPAVCIGVILSAFACRALLIHRGDALAGYVLAPSRADTLLFGALLAIGFRSGARVRDAIDRAAPSIAAVALVTLTALFVTHQLDHRLSTGGLLFGSAATTVLTAACIARIRRGGRIRRLLEWAPLVSFGTYSYAIYLVQLPIRGGIDALFGTRLNAFPSILGVAAELAMLAGASWCMAWISWRVLESPMLALKRYVPMPRDSTRAATPLAGPVVAMDIE